jgi:hypothetical protein
MLTRFLIALAAVIGIGTAARANPAVPVPTGYTEVDGQLKYGILCNGMSDERVRLQNAVNGLKSYEALRLPAGTCKSSAMIFADRKANIAILGAGKDSTILLFTNIGSTPDDGSGGLVVKGSNILVGDLQSQWAKPTRRGHKPAQTCFAALGGSSYITFDSVKAVRCKGGGILFVAVKNSQMLNSDVDHSKADAFHAFQSADVLMDNLTAVGPGDDCFAFIAGSKGYGYRGIVRNSSCRDTYWGSGGHADKWIDVLFQNVHITNVGASCFAATSDGKWSMASGTATNQIVFDSVVAERCVNRTTLGHASFSFYTANKSPGTVGPDIIVRNSQVRDPISGPGVRAWGFTGKVSARIEGVAFCGMGGKRLAAASGVGSLSTSGLTRAEVCP